MKEKYYHIMDKDGEKRVTVCLIVETWHIPAKRITGKASLEYKWARGLALRSFDDPYIEHIGNGIARRAAIRALKGREIEPIRTKAALDILIACRCPWVRRGERNPVLSAFERRLLWGKGWAREHALHKPVTYTQFCNTIRRKIERSFMVDPAAEQNM